MGIGYGARGRVPATALRGFIVVEPLCATTLLSLSCCSRCCFFSLAPRH